MNPFPYPVTPDVCHGACLLFAIRKECDLTTLSQVNTSHQQMNANVMIPFSGLSPLQLANNNVNGCPFTIIPNPFFPQSQLPQSQFPQQQFLQQQFSQQQFSQQLHCNNNSNEILLLPFSSPSSSSSSSSSSYSSPSSSSSSSYSSSSSFGIISNNNLGTSSSHRSFKNWQLFDSKRPVSAPPPLSSDVTFPNTCEPFSVPLSQPSQSSQSSQSSHPSQKPHGVVPLPAIVVSDDLIPITKSTNVSSAFSLFNNNKIPSRESKQINATPNTSISAFTSAFIPTSAFTSVFTHPPTPVSVSTTTFTDPSEPTPVSTFSSSSGGNCATSSTKFLVDTSESQFSNFSNLPPSERFSFKPVPRGRVPALFASLEESRCIQDVHCHCFYAVISKSVNGRNTYFRQPVVVFGFVKEHDEYFAITQDQDMFLEDQTFYCQQISQKHPPYSATANRVTYINSGVRKLAMWRIFLPSCSNSPLPLYWLHCPRRKNQDHTYSYQSQPQRLSAPINNNNAINVTNNNNHINNQTTTASPSSSPSPSSSSPSPSLPSSPFALDANFPLLSISQLRTSASFETCFDFVSFK